MSSYQLGRARLLAGHVRERSGRHRRPGFGLRLLARAGLVPGLRRLVLSLVLAMALWTGN